MGGSNSTQCSDGRQSKKNRQSILRRINRQIRPEQRGVNNSTYGGSNASVRASYGEYKHSGEVFFQDQEDHDGQFVHYTENGISFHSSEPKQRDNYSVYEYSDYQNQGNSFHVGLCNENEVPRVRPRSVSATSFNGSEPKQRNSYSVNEYGSYQNEVDSFHVYNEDVVHVRPRSVSSECGSVNYARPVYKCNSLNYEHEGSHYNQLFSASYDGFNPRCHSLNDLSYGNRYNRSFSVIANEADVAQNSSLVKFRKLSFDNINSRPDSANSASSSVNYGRFKRNSLDDENANGKPYDGGSYNCDDNQSFDGRRVKRKQEDGFVYSSQPNDISEGANKERNYPDQSWLSQNETNDNNVDFFSQLDISFDVLDILSFPSVWSSCGVDRAGYVDIPFSSPEGKSVAKFFHRSSKSREFQLKIIGITRVENLFLHSLYLLKKEEIASQSGHVDELFLFHGTKREHVSKICEDNLNWRLFSEKHKFGQGVSFSPVATYSSHYSDNTVVKVMFLFKVLVSNVTLGSPEMTVPPNVDGVTFDTSIKEDTNVIVKYCDNEFYPLYTINYTKCLLKT